MSRSNPAKKKKRFAKRTLLIFGEGLGEEIFLKHLRSIYSFDSNAHIDIRRGKGGDACSIVIDADKVPASYDYKYVVLDNDKSGQEMTLARQEAKKRNIELIENTPCLEFILVTILDREPSGKNSKWCKGEFESKYLSKQKRVEISRFASIFPKELLDVKRVAVPKLNKLISIMEGK